VQLVAQNPDLSERVTVPSTVTACFMLSGEQPSNNYLHFHLGQLRGAGYDLSSYASPAWAWRFSSWRHGCFLALR
jgi:hypothetical protein